MNELTNHKITFTDVIKPLTNFTAICYANSAFQVMFSIRKFREFINRLPNDDHLFLFASRYFNQDTRRITSSKFYTEMDLSAPEGEADDIISIFTRLLNKYPDLNQVFGVVDRIEGESIFYRSYLGIERKDSIQEGIDSTRFNREHLPPVLNVVADRQYVRNDGVSTFTKQAIPINNFLKINENYYKLKGIIIHSGSTSSGHFRAIVLTNEGVVCADDSKITKGCNFDTNYVYQNAIMCIYEECEPSIYLPDTFFVIEKSTTNDSIVHSDSENNDLNCTGVEKNIENGSKRKLRKETMPTDALFIKDKDISSLRDIPDEIQEEILGDDWENTVHNRTIKSNIHDEFLYMHGYLNTDISNAPIKDIKASNPQFQAKLDTLSIFIKTLGKIEFNYKESHGDYNAEVISDALKIEALIPTQEQAVEAATKLRQYIDTLDPTKVPDEETVSRNINNLLSDIIFDNDFITESDCYSEDPVNIKQEEEEMFYALGPKYNWRARCEELNVGEIANKLKEYLSYEIDEETPDMKNRKELREKLWHDYIENIHKYDSINKFAEAWVESRNKGKLKTDITFSVSYAGKLIRKFNEQGDVTSLKKRSGVEKKINEEAMLCLLTTVLDFPEATDSERTEYLNKYSKCGIQEVCIKTVNNALQNLKLTVKNPSFSPRARNCFGYRVARILWGQVLKSIAETSNTVVCFIDEAGVVLSKRQKARGFMSVVPITTRPLFRGSISNIACVIPGFGVIYKWYNGGVNSKIYAKFIRDAAYIVRNKLCNEQTQIVFVNDNASIHKTKLVIQTAIKCKVNIAYTVPYSPQTNIPVENYFAQMKHVVCYKFQAVSEEQCDTNKLPLQHKHMAIKDYILRQWDWQTKTYYDYENTSKIYGVWLNVLDMCIEGCALTGQHICCKQDYNPLTLHGILTTKRK